MKRRLVLVGLIVLALGVVLGRAFSSSRKHLFTTPSAPPGTEAVMTASVFPANSRLDTVLYHPSSDRVEGYFRVGAIFPVSLAFSGDSVTGYVEARGLLRDVRYPVAAEVTSEHAKGTMGDITIHLERTGDRITGKVGKPPLQGFDIELLLDSSTGRLRGTFTGGALNAKTAVEGFSAKGQNPLLLTAVSAISDYFFVVRAMPLPAR